MAKEDDFGRAVKWGCGLSFGMFLFAVGAPICLLVALVFFGALVQSTTPASREAAPRSAPVQYQTPATGSGTFTPPAAPVPFVQAKDYDERVKNIRVGASVERISKVLDREAIRLKSAKTPKGSWSVHSWQLDPYVQLVGTFSNDELVSYDLMGPSGVLKHYE